MTSEAPRLSLPGSNAAKSAGTHILRRNKVRQVTVENIAPRTILLRLPPSALNFPSPYSMFLVQLISPRATAPRLEKF